MADTHQAFREEYHFDVLTGCNCLADYQSGSRLADLNLMKMWTTVLFLMLLYPPPPPPQPVPFLLVLAVGTSLNGTRNGTTVLRHVQQTRHSVHCTGPRREGRRSLPPPGLEPATSRSSGQCLQHQDTPAAHAVLRPCTCCWPIPR